MKKQVTLKIPKGTKCKNGICEQDIELDTEIEIPETKPSFEFQPNASFEFNTESIPQIQKPIQQETKKSKEPELSHEDLADLMPKGVNFGKCADGSCGDKIKNKKFVTKFKTCPNCDSNSVPKSHKFCPTCGIDEDQQDEDFWQESEVELERDDEE